MFRMCVGLCGWAAETEAGREVASPRHASSQQRAGQQWGRGGAAGAGQTPTQRWALGGTEAGPAIGVLLGSVSSLSSWPPAAVIPQ